MSLLVPAGLFVVALLAIGGAFWLALGERQSSQRRQSSQAVQAPALDTLASASSSGNQSEPQMSGEQTATSAPLARRQGIEQDQDRFVSVPTRQLEDIEVTNHPFSMLDGQFYELAAEIRALHRESQDIERRLDTLSTLVNRIESEYGEVGVEVE